jgi:hypothetical protein
MTGACSSLIVGGRSSSMWPSRQLGGGSWGRSKALSACSRCAARRSGTTELERWCSCNGSQIRNGCLVFRRTHRTGWWKLGLPLDRISVCECDDFGCFLCSDQCFSHSMSNLYATFLSTHFTIAVCSILMQPYSSPPLLHQELAWAQP